MILVLIAYALSYPSNTHAQSPDLPSGLDLGVSLYLRPYFGHVSSAGYGEMRSLVWAFDARIV